jgi:hypothetical protein
MADEISRIIEAREQAGIRICTECGTAVAVEFMESHFYRCGTTFTARFARTPSFNEKQFVLAGKSEKK